MTKPNALTRTIWSTIARLTTRRARAVLIVAVCVGCISIWGASRLRPVASIEAMLSDQSPASRALARIATDFGGLEELIVLVSEAKLPSAKSASVLNSKEQLLAFARRLTEKIKTSETLSKTCSEVDYRPSGDARGFVESVIVPNATLYIDDAQLSALKQRLTPKAMREQLRQAEQRLSAPGAASGALTRATLQDPLSLRDFLIDALPRPPRGNLFADDDGFFSQDGRHLLIRLHGSKSASNLEFSDTFVTMMKAAASSVNEDSLEISFTGAYAIAAEAQHAIRSDMIRSLALSIVFLQVLYLLAYRRLWVLPAALAPVALGIVSAFALFAALGMNLSPMTAVIGAILAGLGVDYCIHLLSHYQNDRASGLSHEAAISQTLESLAPALIAACLTTVIGFLAISQSSVQALREFGLLGAMGLIASLVASILVLPAILSVSVGVSNPSTTKQTQHTLATRLLRHAIKHRHLFLWLGGVVAMGAIGESTYHANRWSIFDDDLTAMHPQPNHSLDTQHRIVELFGVSPDSLLIHLEANSADELTTLAHRVDDRLSQINPKLSTIVGSFSLASLIPDPSTLDSRLQTLKTFNTSQIISDFNEALANTAFNPAAFDKYKIFLQQLTEPVDLPTLSDLRRFPKLAQMVLPTINVSNGHDETESVMTIITSVPLARRSDRDAAITAVRGAIGNINGATLTGFAVIGHDAENAIRNNLGKLLTIAASVVLLWLIVYFRSLSAPLLALVPTLFGMAMLLACMRLFGLTLNTINLIALPLLVGIGVDDGIFLVTKAREAKQRDPSGLDLIDKLSASCHAVSMTSLTTMLTFGTLAFTSMPAIRSLGVLMAIGVFSSLVGTIWILAPMLTAINKSTSQPTTIYDSSCE